MKEDIVFFPLHVQKHLLTSRVHHIKDTKLSEFMLRLDHQFHSDTNCTIVTENHFSGHCFYSCFVMFITLVFEKSSKSHHPRSKTRGTLAVNADDGCASTNQLRSSEMTTRIDYATWSDTVALAFAYRLNTEPRMVNISHGQTVQTHRHLCVVAGKGSVEPKTASQSLHLTYVCTRTCHSCASLSASRCFNLHARNPQNASDLSFPKQMQASRTTMWVSY